MPQVNVTTGAAQRIDTAAGGGSQRSLLVRNRGTGSVWIDRVSTVTNTGATAGFELQVGEAATVPGITTGLWAFALVGPQRLDLLQVGVG